MVKEHIRKHSFQYRLSFLSSPNPGIRHGERAIVVIFACPPQFICDLHMLENTLFEMVDEQFVEWPRGTILDMVQFKISAIDICATVCKRGDSVVVLCKESDTWESLCF